jgi:hypothetical protein
MARTVCEHSDIDKITLWKGRMEQAWACESRGVSSLSKSSRDSRIAALAPAGQSLRRTGRARASFHSFFRHDHSAF